MSTLAMETAKLIDMLPENDQVFALEFVKKLVLAWDPDYTKLTDDESVRLNEAERGEFLSSNKIDWDNIGKYAQ